MPSHGKKGGQGSKSKETPPDGLTAKWNNLASYDRYDKPRALFRPAVREAVVELLGQYLDPAGKIIEIGAGMGEFVHKIIPPDSPFRGIIETEQAPVVIAHRRRNSDIPPVVSANVYNLTSAFPRNSVDGVVGYSSFDTFANLRGAVHQMREVLKPGGKIVHILDMHASPNTFYHNFDHKKRGQVPIPIVRGGVHVGVALVDKLKIMQAISSGAISVWNRKQIQAFLDNPERSYIEISTQEGLIEQYAAEFEKVFGDMSQFEFVGYNEYFFQRAQEALRAEGFRILEIGIKQGTTVIDRKDAIDNIGFLEPFEGAPVINFVRTEFGDGQRGFNPEVRKQYGPDAVQITQGVHVIVAEKVA